MMSASIDRVDSSALGRERYENRILHRFELGPAIMASADSRLVGDHDHRNTPLVGGSDDFRRSGYDADFLDPVQISDFLNNDTIAIQEQGGAASSRPL
jgi:hypothetical protein